MDKRIIEETPSTEVLNDDWFIKDSPTGGTSKILGSKLKEIISGDVEDSIDKILDSIAPEWSSTFTYGFDAYVIYEGELWRCFKDTGSTVGEFKTSEWIKAVTSGYITHVVNKIADRFVASNPPFMTYRYSVGDMVFYSEPYHDEQLYVCNTDLPQGESTFNPEHWDVVYTVAGLSKYLMDKIAEAGQIDDVQVKTTGDYESVVDNKVAKIDLSNMLIEKSVPNLPQSVATFNDGSDLPLKSLTASIVPVQDLHGYDSPWAGGAGKNKLAMNISDIKSLNNTGTWNGDTYTINGAEYKINIDTAGNITSINARSATSKPNGDLKIATTLPTNSYILSSGFTETNGANDTFLQKDGVTIARGNNSSPGTNFTITESSEVVLHIRLSRNDSSFICTPMIRLSSVTDATFAPYSNICPISGWTEEAITVTDDLQNPTVTHTTTIPFTDSQGQSVEVFDGSVDVVNGGEQQRTLAKVDLGSLNWSAISGQNGVFGATVNGLKTYNYGVTPDMLCSIYKTAPSSYNDPYISANGIIWTYVGVSAIRIKDTAYSDAEAFKASVTGQQFVYELATPTTFYTQPTSIKSLDGVNNVFASTGDVTKLEYIANATDVIANLEARVTALENA